MEAFAIKGLDGNFYSVADSEENAWKRYCNEDDREHEFRRGIRCVPVQITEGWIPVADRLPEEKDADGVGEVLHYWSGCKGSYKAHWTQVRRAALELDKLPGHVWQPLPPPPKEA